MISAPKITPRTFRAPPAQRHAADHARGEMASSIPNALSRLSCFEDPVFEK
jgi:hypothetical protein